MTFLQHNLRKQMCYIKWERIFRSCICFLLHYFIDFLDHPYMRWTFWYNFIDKWKLNFYDLHKSFNWPSALFCCHWLIYWETIWSHSHHFPMRSRHALFLGDLGIKHDWIEPVTTTLTAVHQWIRTILSLCFSLRTSGSVLITSGNVCRLFFPLWNQDGDRHLAGLCLSLMLMSVSLLIMFTRLKLLRWVSMEINCSFYRLSSAVISHNQGWWKILRESYNNVFIGKWR